MSDHNSLKSRVSKIAGEVEEDWKMGGLSKTIYEDYAMEIVSRLMVEHEAILNAHEGVVAAAEKANAILGELKFSDPMSLQAMAAYDELQKALAKYREVAG